MPGYSRDEELFSSLALVKARGLGPRTWGKLLEKYGSPAGALDRFQSWKDDGLVRDSQFNTFASGAWEKEVRHELLVMDSKNLQVIIWSDPEYPARLKQIIDPPLILYYRGDVSLLKNSSLAAVGSRQSSRYGQEMAMRICRDVSQAGLTVVSGFAHGIDRQAHLASVDNPGGTIAVLGTGIDLIYPAMNKDLWKRIAEKGLIMTEFCPGTKPDPGNFPFRNRLISGLSLGVLVVQSAIKSGSMITAQLALEQNKEVFAVPGAVDMDNYEGCNHLIKQGAHLVQQAADVLEVLAPMLRVDPAFKKSPGPGIMDQVPAAAVALDSDEKMVAGKLSVSDRVHIDHLTQSLGWPSQKVSQVLVVLEIKGLVGKDPGMYYFLKRRLKI